MKRGIAFAVTIGMRDHGGSDQPVAVLHQSMAQIAQLRFLAVALLVEPRIGIGCGLVSLIGSLLAMEIRAVAARTILRPEALLRSPRLDQRAVHCEMLVGHELLRLAVHLGEE